MAVTGSQTVGTSAVALTDDANAVVYETRVKAAAANTGTVYVGFSDGVTANSDPSTDGFELSADEEVVVPVALAATTDLIWLVASDAAQKVSFLAV